MTTDALLREKLEQATGPDRELDYRVWAAMEGRDVVEETGSNGGTIVYADKPGKLAPDRQLLGFRLGDGTFHEDTRNYFARPVTGSLDAALAIGRQKLGLRGWWRVSWSHDGKASAAVSLHGEPVHAVEGPTAPLAILKALLSALPQENQP